MDKEKDVTVFCLERLMDVLDAGCVFSAWRLRTQGLIAPVKLFVYFRHFVMS